jgi:sec-independent protein translocase protein TatA
MGAPEIILILVAVLLLFGGKKIPELMKGLGKGMKEFKESQSGEMLTTVRVEADSEEKFKMGN